MVNNDFATGLLIFLGVSALMALVFGALTVIRVLKGIGNLLFGNPPPPQQQPRGNIAPFAPQPAPPPRTFPNQTIAPPVSMRGVSVAGSISGVPCQGPGCRQINPAQARFCRRCGHPISQVTAAAQRRVAMW